jgi:hypothetical protein
MLSGRRKRDYEAESLATQAATETATESGGISPNEAAEVEVMTAADSSTDEAPTSEDDQVLVLA